MEDRRAEQKEALAVLIEFNDRVLKNMNIIVKELSGERMEDTNQFLKGIVDALNWEIQVVNGTIELLNEGKERINKEAFNASVVRLGDAIKANEDAAMAEAIKALIPMFENLGAAAREEWKGGRRQHFQR